MGEMETWDWQPGKRKLADIAAIRREFQSVHEFVASPDGERIAAPVVPSEGACCAVVNGTLWPQTFEKLWYLRFGANGKLTALVRIDDEWTLAVEGEPWQERFEYAWAPRWSANGQSVGLLYKRDNQYGVAVDDKAWEKSYVAIRDYCLSPDGQHAAATVQVEDLKAADIFTYFAGVWSVAVDGEPWPRKFVNTWAPRFDSSGTSVAAEIRTDICEYSIAVDAEPWKATYGCVWEPLFRNGTRNVLAPVLKEGKWTLAEDGAPIWNGLYNQLWHQRLSPDGKRIAAVASPEFGLWTIAIDDTPWRTRVSEMVLPPVFSPDGKRVAAAMKMSGGWTIVIDDKPCGTLFDMVWDPVFSPCGTHVIAKVERGGTKGFLLNGKVGRRSFEQLWEPLFSPDGKQVLLRYIEDGAYVREVVPVETLAG